jgi:hypothetical protein
MPYRKGAFNRNAIDLLFKAYKAKKSGIVSAILLLTNNGSIDYVYKVLRDLKTEFHNLNKNAKINTSMFDNIYSGQRKQKAGSEDNIFPDFEFLNKSREYDEKFKRGNLKEELVYVGNIRKSLQDVKSMLDEVQIPSDNLENRVFFFDDIPFHKMIDELPKDHYVVITPPYNSKTEDKTDYSVINRILDSELEKLAVSKSQTAGSRKSKRRNKGKSRKIRRLSKYFSLYTI